MKALNYFIIQLENPYNETFKTKGGVELYGNVDFTADRLSNRVAAVKSVPELFDSEISINDEVLIDFSNFYRQIYQGTKQHYQNVVDADKNLYYIEPSMIICYRKNANSEWKGYLQNCLVKPILEETKIKTTIILPENITERKFKGKVKMIFSNQELSEHGINNDDLLLMDVRGGIKYWVDGEEYWWVRNKDIYGKLVPKTEKHNLGIVLKSCGHKSTLTRKVFAKKI